ncbi:ATP synthase subunit delta [Nitritalea halalkaliphila LW7]|uniref:ATP synthase subunit delta n=1 Tax=Nitritalea halalkaliphila LW7 TaxID=1189621 RepID=I5BZP4_9BACT|nr:ATP synthase F1 subunit delta [Nitritalea halalkaliphila]EIM75046.1 ATP synthase subunit delta [Nitritalea halalkaliphila LW7]
MSEFRVASRYAKSLLELAVENKVLEAVKADVNRIMEACQANKELVFVLKSPVVSSDKKFAILQALLGTSGQKLTVDFLRIVADKNRASLTVDILKQFVRLYNVHEGIQEATVTTAFPLTDELRKAFEGTVKEISGLAKVQLVETVDTAIIGGFILRVNDRQLDESLSGKLRALRLQLTKNQYEKLY